MTEIHCSSLPRVMACPASLVPPAVRVETESEAARVGTAVHEALACHVRSPGIFIDVWGIAENHPATHRNYPVLKNMSVFADKYSEESALGVNTMFDQFVNGISNLCIVLLLGLAIVALHKLNNKQIRKHQDSMEFYLYKISRVTGHSEYDV